MPSLATFNANNLFLRYKFPDAYPGDRSKKSKAEAADAMNWGFLPQISKGKFSSQNYIFWDDARRKAAADALKGGDNKLPDILCLQEVESMAALRKFNDEHLKGHYTHFMLIDGLDMRQIDVAVMSVWPIQNVRSNIDLTKDKRNIFSRDCLELEIDVPNTGLLTLFVNHFKSKMTEGNTPDKKVASVKGAHEKRELQAKTVAGIVKERMQGKKDTALFAVLGDFNDTPTSPSVTPLTRHGWLTDVVTAHLPRLERYTYFWRDRNKVSQIDFILASKALAKKISARAAGNKKFAPHIERSGMSFKLSAGKDKTKILQPSFTFFEPDSRYATDADGNALPPEKIAFDFPRLKSVIDDPKMPVSDHAPVKVWF